MELPEDLKTERKRAAVFGTPATARTLPPLGGRLSKKFMLAVWDLDLPRPEKAVLGAFGWNADEEGKNSRPSVGTVGERAGYSIRQTHNIIARLKARGVLRVEGKHTSSHGYVVSYAIDLSGVPRLSGARSLQKLQTSSAQKLQTSSLQSGALSVQSGALSLQSSADEQVNQNRKTRAGKSTPEVFALRPSEATSKTKTAPKNRKQNWVPPCWVPLAAWEGFSEMRKKTGAPLTDRACELIVTELEKLKASGHDVGAVLDQSTVNDWKRIFPITGGNHHGARRRNNGSHTGGFHHDGDDSKYRDAADFFVDSDAGTVTEK